jgi:predicted MPP superfamily phosphohydrolase
MNDDPQTVATVASQPDVVTILHLSDLHFRAGMDPDFQARLDAFRICAAELKPSPDIVVCTGDLVDNPLGWDDEAYADAAKAAVKWLEETCRSFGFEAKDRLVVVPGNHDYRKSGVADARNGWGMMCWTAVKEALGLKKSADSGTAQKSQPIATDKALFENHFKPYFRPLMFPDFKVCVLPLDTNQGEHLLDLAGGEISMEEMNRFSRMIAEFEKGGDYSACHKIVAMHHHPMPIPRSETDAQVDLEPTLMLKNAGVLMKQLIQNRMDIILHGHKHHPGYSTASFEVDRSLSHPIHVLAAGTVAKTDAGYFSFNVLRLRRNGKSECLRFSRSTSAASFDPARPLVFPLGPREDVRRDRFQRLLRRHNPLMLCEEFRARIIINEHGDRVLRIELGGLRPLRGLIDTYSLAQHDPWAVITKTAVRNVGQYHHVVDIEQADSSRHRLCFRPPLSAENKNSPWILLESSAASMYAVTEEACRLKKMDGSNREEFEFGSATVATNRLEIEIEFPPGLRIEGAYAEALDENGNKDEEEEVEIQPYFSFDKERNTARICINHPLPRHKYSITWRVPPVDAALKDEAVATCRAIDKALLDPAAASRLDPLLNDLQARISSDSDFGSASAGDCEINLLAFDKADGSVRCIAGTQPAADPIRTHRWKLGPTLKQGLEGRCYSSRRTYFGNSAWAHWTSFHQPPYATSNEAMVSCWPFFYPKDKAHRVVFILRIATANVASNLVRLASEDSTGERDDFARRFLGNELYFAIGQALGLSRHVLEKSWKDMAFSQGALDTPRNGG